MKSYKLHMKHIQDEQELNLNGFTTIKFYTKWCAPCKRLDSILTKMEGEFQNVTIYCVDIDKFHKIAQKYKVMSVPTMVFFNDKKEVNRIAGLVLTEPLRKAFKQFTS